MERSDSRPRSSLISCPACRQDTLLKREPRYDGFMRVGESLSCASCGLPFPDEASVPFKVRAAVPGFGLSDVPPPPRVFREDEVRAETSRLCRHCAHYVVNPFLQRCGRTRRAVEATDTCGHFEPKPSPEDAAPPG